ncbi:hypothetical protein UB32_01050 [Mesobacillus subterraneus]|uniref:Uncharacterized protein n=1 Tax=Mesobacillus subterraneus TaxID=285983 RepID=A0A0D6ZF76_9BACI|nr:hypothetical protein UB32_01050 [Mesobacillus subterraneus]
MEDVAEIQDLFEEIVFVESERFYPFGLHYNIECGKLPYMKAHLAYTLDQILDMSKHIVFWFHQVLLISIYALLKRGKAVRTRVNFGPVLREKGKSSPN